MKKKKNQYVDIDTEKFTLYLHTPSENVIAIERTETERLDRLIKNNSGIENIPDDEFVEGISLSYDSRKKVSNIQFGLTQNYRINELSFYWIKK